MDEAINMEKSRRLNAIGKCPAVPTVPAKGFAIGKKVVTAGFFCAAMLLPALAQAECTKLIDKHLEYYDGIKDHFPNSPNFDPGVKKIPYDVEIIDNKAQQYPLLTTNISFFFPNTADSSSDFGFQGAEPSGYIPALCIIQTPDGLKWVVWNDNFRLWFFDEDEQPH